MARLFTSDTHFFHKNILTYTERGKYTTVDNHTDWLLSIINKQVKPGDTLYILGDVAFTSSHTQLEDLLLRINCQVFVVKGNHDSNTTWKRVGMTSMAAKNKLVAVKDYAEIKLDSCAGRCNTLCMFHFPISAWHKQGYGSYHAHGHTHGMYQGAGKSLDVGIDNAYNVFGEHRLFTEADIEAFMATRDIVVTDGHTNRTT